VKDTGRNEKNRYEALDVLFSAKVQDKIIVVINQMSLASLLPILELVHFLP